MSDLIPDTLNYGDRFRTDPDDPTTEVVIVKGIERDHVVSTHTWKTVFIPVVLHRIPMQLRANKYVPVS